MCNYRINLFTRKLIDEYGKEEKYEEEEYGEEKKQEDEEEAKEASLVRVPLRELCMEYNTFI